MTTEAYRKPPKVFVSYTHQDESHKAWVRRLASDLLFNGIEVKLDQFDLRAGQDLYHFMESGLTDNDFILVVCTPSYKLKADNRQGGGGYETRIAAAFLATDLLTRKFIPILREGNAGTSIPTYLRASLYIDFSNEDSYSSNILSLVETLFGTESKPALGWRKQELSAIFGATDSASDPSFTERITAPRNQTAPLQFAETIEDLRAASEVSRINEVHKDRLVSEFDTPVFGFTVPWILNTVDRGIVGGTGPDKISLQTEPFGTAQLEVHRRLDGTIAFVGFSDRSITDALQASGHLQSQTITLFVTPHEKYCVPISVPVALIRAYRQRSLGRSSIYLVDVRLA